MISAMMTRIVSTLIESPRVENPACGRGIQSLTPSFRCLPPFDIEPPVHECDALSHGQQAHASSAAISLHQVESSPIVVDVESDLVSPRMEVDAHSCRRCVARGIAHGFLGDAVHSFTLARRNELRRDSAHSDAVRRHRIEQDVEHGADANHLVVGDSRLRRTVRWGIPDES
jgi:hypothetical protein